MDRKKEFELNEYKLLKKLVAWGVIRREQFEQARDLARKEGIGLSRALHRLEISSSPDLYTAVSEYFGIPYIDLEHFTPEQEALILLPQQEAEKLQVIPLFRLRDYIMVANADPTDISALDRVEELTGLEVGRALADQSTLERSINRIYRGTEAPEAMIEGLEEELDFTSPELEEPAERQGLDESAPVAELVSNLIKRAVRERASDVHINPEAREARVRFRIDGILRPVFQISMKILPPIVSHIKVLSNMDIAVSMRPQDGEFHSALPGGDIDVRVSVLPTIHGENVAMRILNADSLMMGLSDLGFSDDLFAKMKIMLAKPHGIILVTGPTGSGKSTTLYSVLSQLDTKELNIITVEDPVEYKLEGIRQVQVNPRAGLTFATALRSIVRQDPDVILIGEIRDLETAEIAVQSALTGHLVLGTLHTNDAPTAVTRLVDMGLQPFLVASSVVGVLAQRLLRKICPACKKISDRDTRLLRELKLAPRIADSKLAAYRGAGCRQCRGTGYEGRTVIGELVIIDYELAEMATRNEPAIKIANKAKEKGMTTLREDAIRKILEGETTLEEAHRVVEIGTEPELIAKSGGAENKAEKTGQ